MKLIALFLVVGMFAVSGCSKKAPTFSPELVSKAEAGDARAQNDLGRCYCKGIGVAQDYNEAVKWWTKASEQLGLRVVEYYGKAGAQDYKEAVNWLTRAAEQGDADAQRSLGCCYCEGIGLTRDCKEAVKWWTKSAEQGNAEAQYDLGRRYWWGCNGYTKDYEKAFKWLTKAAEQGNADAQANLGVCYAWGTGATKDYKESVKWLTKAAEQGNAEAKYNLRQLEKLKSK